MTARELVANLRRMADDLEKLFGDAPAPRPRIDTTRHTAKDAAPRGGIRKKGHWSQTAAGKAKISRNMKKFWREKNGK